MQFVQTVALVQVMQLLLHTKHMLLERNLFNPQLRHTLGSVGLQFGQAFRQFTQRRLVGSRVYPTVH